MKQTNQFDLFHSVKILNERDKSLSRLFSNYEVNDLKPEKNYLKSLIRSIIYQQLSAKAAKKIFERENFIVKPYPVDFISKKATKKVFLYNPYNWLPNSNSLNESSIVFREIIGRIVYRSW